MLKNLRALRLEKKMSQKQLADAVAVSQQSINKYENHSVEPDIKTLILLAEYFNVSVDYLIGHSDIRRKYEEIRPFDLNESESAFMECFRQLTPKQQASIKSVMDNYIELKK